MGTRWQAQRSSSRFTVCLSRSPPPILSRLSLKGPTTAVDLSNYTRRRTDTSPHPIYINMSGGSDAPHDPSVGPRPGHGEAVQFNSHSPDSHAKEGEQHQAHHQSSEPSSHSSGHLNPHSHFDPSSLTRRRSPKQANKDLHLNTEEANRLAAEREQSHEGLPRRPGALSSDPDARSKTVTMADGENTFGVSSSSKLAITSNG